MIKNVINRIVDKIRRKDILTMAVAMGCDIDGDFVTYKGVRYLVYLYDDEICRV